MKPRLLYAEDEPHLSRLVIDNLEAEGYEVIHAQDGDEALRLFGTAKPDLCLIDVMMPVMDGYTVVERIRRENAAVPILYLSAKSLDEDLVRGFRSGGNDYLKKPFSMIELLVRLDYLLKRAQTPKDEQEAAQWYEFAGCRLDTVHQQLITRTATFDLSYKEALLLEMLLRHKNKVLERQPVLLKIWGNDSIYNANSMNVFITHLRRMLKDEPGVRIINIRGVGYKLLC